MASASATKGARKPFNMYTDPIIVQSTNPAQKSYVKLHFKGKRLRFYSGNSVGIRCFPNEAKSSEVRMRLLKVLQYELKKQLEKGWNPLLKYESAATFTGCSVSTSIEKIIIATQSEDVSDRYRADLKRIGQELRLFMKGEHLLKAELASITVMHLQKFLAQFSSSATYYMTKRRTLAGLFRRMVELGMLSTNPVKGTSRKKEVHNLNVAYNQVQLKGLLSYLQDANPALFICALLMYGCFLRPHREIRLLQRRHFNTDFTRITLSGAENKSKRVRMIELPEYITKALIAYGAQSLQPQDYLIGRSATPVNKDYFTTAWTRQKKHFPKEFMLSEGQTLYSFRHTGALAVYNKTKDPYRVQQAMFHGSLKVTLTYLRSLGLISNSGNSDLPELEL